MAATAPSRPRSSLGSHPRLHPVPDCPPPSYTPQSPGYTVRELLDPSSQRRSRLSTDLQNLDLVGASDTSAPGTEAPRSRPRYLYYRVYSSEGSIEVKTPEFPEDPWLGRTLVHRITPPHTAARIKQHLARLEAINDLGNTSLFANVSCPAPLEDTEFIDTRDMEGLGSVPEDPLALVVPVSSSPSSATPPAQGNAQTPFLVGGQGRANCYRLRTLRDLLRPVAPERDLSFVKGEILITNGVIRNPGTSAAHLYARNANGKMGLVWQHDVEFIGHAPPALRLARIIAARRLGLR